MGLKGNLKFNLRTKEFHLNSRPKAGVAKRFLMFILHNEFMDL